MGSDVLLGFARTGRTARELVLRAADLRGADLQGLRADGLDLNEADLRDSRLCEARWRACTLCDARLEGADLTGAMLRLCILDDARAANARLVNARIEDGQARAARFDGADLTGAVLDETDFSRASLRGAIMENVSATGADFRGADLREARLRGAALRDADLRGADLTGADLADADLSGADLRGALLGNEAVGGGTGDTVARELRPLVETMAPLVAQVLGTAGRHAVMPPDTARRLVDEARRLSGSAPETAEGTDAMAAVSRILPLLGADLLPKLAQALKLPAGTPPPAEVRETILALRRELGLAGDAATEDVLASLARGLRKGAGSS